MDLQKFVDCLSSEERKELACILGADASLTKFPVPTAKELRLVRDGQMESALGSYCFGRQIHVDEARSVLEYYAHGMGY